MILETDIRHLAPSDVEHDAKLQYVAALIVEKAAQVGWLKAPAFLLDRHERKFAEQVLKEEFFNDRELLATIDYILKHLQMQGEVVGVTEHEVAKLYRDLRG